MMGVADGSTLKPIVDKLGTTAPATLAAALVKAWGMRRNAEPAKFPADILALSVAHAGTLGSASGTLLTWSQSAQALHKSVVDGTGIGIGFQGAERKFASMLPDLVALSNAEFRGSATVPGRRLNGNVSFDR